MSWNSYLLGDILKRRKSIERISSEKEYKLVTIKLHHKGVTLRQVVNPHCVTAPISAAKKIIFAKNCTNLG